MKKVIIIQKSLHQYRKEFFIYLKEELQSRGIELTLVYGQPGSKEGLKSDDIKIEWAIFRQSKIIRILNHELYWQPVLSLIKDFDLIIVEQASKLLINYFLVILNILKLKKVAFWGHGKNFQQTSSCQLAESIKASISIHVHWWFAYNDLSVKVVRDLGFPPNKITNVQNAIDTKKLLQIYNRTKEKDKEVIKKQLGIKGENICLFIGGMYPEKRLSFLIEALHIIHIAIPDFSMLFIGSGVDADLVIEAAERYPWIYYLGSLFDEDKVPYFVLSKLLLMPGQVGLAILDSFTMETPLVTTDNKLHAPEISYLTNKINGIMVESSHDVYAYANAVIDLLQNESYRQSLIKGCIEARDKFSIEEMTTRFANGIEEALS